MTDETIFAAALGKPDRAERTAFVAEACGSDPELLRRVAGLLAAHDKAGEFLNRPAVGPPDPEEAATRAYRAPGADAGDGPTRTLGEGSEGEPNEGLTFLAPPRRPDSLGRIGHYEVLEVLGRGGFGIVFRAFDEVLQRVVAVKVLAPQMAALSPARKRFLREARSSAQVRHENVVQVYAVEEQPLPFLVMEYIPGETLQQRLDRNGPLEVAEVLRIGRQIAEGLAAAHERGLIHRDVKPANVMIEGGPQHRVKLTDFGLARAADDASISQSGVVAGTPMYMAPEQAKGESLDHRADLFSLGSVLYVMATGRPPFRANSTLAVLKRVADEEPRPIREIIPEVPEWFCRIVEKLHAKDPDERYQSAREVADVLADCEAQLKAHAEVRNFTRIPEGEPEPAPPRIERWKWVAAAALACLLLVTVGITLFTKSVSHSGSAQVVKSIEERLVVVNVEELDGKEVRLRLAGKEFVFDRVGEHQIYLPVGPHQAEWMRPGKPPLVQGIYVAVNGETRLTVRAWPVPPDPDGFVQLFNGKDLTGWKVFPADRTSWKVENGILVGSGKPSHLFTGRGDFTNFHLRMETRIKRVPKGGAVGVFARVPFEDPGMILVPHGKESLYKIPVPKLYDDKAAPPDPAPPSYRDGPHVVWGVDNKGQRTSIKQFPADEWFTHELILDGKNITVRTTAGTASSESFIAAGAKTESGHLALQLFDDWSVVQFRKIEIKELPPVRTAKQEPDRKAPE